MGLNQVSFTLRLFPDHFRTQNQSTISIELVHGIQLALVRAIDEGLTLETSAFKLFTVANLRFKLDW